MKRKALLSALVALTLGSALYADTLSVSKGWNMFGQTTAISTMSVFDSPAGCVGAVYPYMNGAYGMYIPGGASNTISQIPANQGYWLLGNSSCTVSTTAQPPAPPSTPTAVAFSKPTQAACTAGGGTWDTANNECRASYDNAMKICTPPSKDDWLSVMASCGANTTVNSSGYYNGTVSGLASCMTGKGFASYGSYWSSTPYDSSYAWDALFYDSGNWYVGWVSRYDGYVVRCAH